MWDYPHYRGNLRQRIGWNLIAYYHGSSFIQNEEIFVQLDEFGEFNIITYAWIVFNYSFTQAQKSFLRSGEGAWLLIKWSELNPWPNLWIFCKFILFNLSN